MAASRLRLILLAAILVLSFIISAGKAVGEPSAEQTEQAKKLFRIFAPHSIRRLKQIC